MLTKSVAIIDDEPDLVELFREALEIDDKKYSISTFTDSIEALNYIKKVQETMHL